MRVISGSVRGTKLNTLEGIETRPTLDRVKESLFNIIKNNINEETVILDLFSGSGALGIESLSRGAKKAVFCDKSKQAIEIINSNLEKTKFLEKSKVINKDYKICLEILKKEKIKFNIIFLDPPYKADYIGFIIRKIIEFDLLLENGIIIVETDDREKIENIKDIEVKIYDKRKYGKVNLMFFKRKE